MILAVVLGWLGLMAALYVALRAVGGDGSARVAFVALVLLPVLGMLAGAVLAGLLLRWL